MRIAFVGKGGAGKSTIASLFSLYLMSLDKNLLIIDADLNIHIPKLLSIDISSLSPISESNNVIQIKKYLIGKNKRIMSVNHMYKTTPPANGSNFLKIDHENYIIKNFAKKIGDKSYFMYVGTYEEKAIGTSCYHTNLSILENILTHSILFENDWIVVDMVAGTDAFANTLHAQFDTLFLILEPTLESVEVFYQYLKLSKSAQVDSRLLVIGNKIENNDDLMFLKEKIGNKLFGVFKKSPKIKSARQKGLAISLDMLDNEDFNNLVNIKKITEENKVDENTRLKKLQDLHLKYSQLDYVKRAVGDISTQIDPSFKF